MSAASLAFPFDFRDHSAHSCGTETLSTGENGELFARQNSQPDDGETLDLGCIVHLCCGQGGNCPSEDTIQKGVEEMNSYLDGAKIKFHLENVSQVESARCTAGLNNDNAMAALKAEFRKGNSSTLNLVYVQTNQGGGTKGQCTVPPAGTAPTSKDDGCVIAADTLPSGRRTGSITTTHEVGHWLSLVHSDQPTQTGPSGLVGRLYGGLFGRQTPTKDANVMQSTSHPGERYSFNQAQFKQMRVEARARLSGKNAPGAGQNAGSQPPGGPGGNPSPGGGIGGNPGPGTGQNNPGGDQNPGFQPPHHPGGNPSPGGGIGGNPGPGTGQNNPGGGQNPGFQPPHRPGGNPSPGGGIGANPGTITGQNGPGGGQNTGFQPPHHPGGSPSPGGGIGANPGSVTGQNGPGGGQNAGFQPTHGSGGNYPSSGSGMGDIAGDVTGQNGPGGGQNAGFQPTHGSGGNYLSSGSGMGDIAGDVTGKPSSNIHDQSPGSHFISGDGQNDSPEPIPASYPNNRPENGVWSVSGTRPDHQSNDQSTGFNGLSTGGNGQFTGINSQLSGGNDRSTGGNSQFPGGQVVSNGKRVISD
ncbi:metalloprotease 1 [Cordyceps javanica]|uniref:Metalloprotease 1 n=1 Tax=Cordyceps javanica TaxID=43265 RepID=A0A545UTB3_9HYPO|nr:metalloprotease 1 [Cordyceps javanica]TQW03333.1 metalloprotease 1 [Cordyceps javanica]